MMNQGSQAVKIFIGGLVTAAFMIACSSGVSPTEPDVRESRTETLQLAPGETASLGGGRSITFESVASDNRCPTDVVCVTAGEAIVRLKLETPSGPTSFELSSTTPRSKTIEGISFEVVLVKPDPISTKRIDQADYRLTLRVNG